MNYPVLGLIIANIIWGAAVPIFKYALGNVPPFTLLFLRFFVAGLLFLPAAIVKWKPLSTREFLDICFAAVCGFSISLSLLFIGLGKAPSINHPIIASASPLVLYVIAVTVLKEKRHKKVLVGSVFSLTGVLLIVLAPLIFTQGGVDVGQIEGNMLFISSMIVHVIYTLRSRPIFKKHNVYQATAVMFLVAAATYAPFMRQELVQWDFSQLDHRGLFGIFYGIIFSSGVAYWLYHWGIARINAQEIGIFTYIDPVVTILVAAPLLGEHPTPHYFVGAALVFIGIFIAEGRLHWHPFHRIRRK